MLVVTPMLPAISCGHLASSHCHTGSDRPSSSTLMSGTSTVR
jgi:hypothetical protein